MGEPLPICFLNDEFLPLREARISPLDRGFLYSDGVYEVTPVYGGRPFRFAQHHARLTRSLREIRMEDPLSPEAWRDLYRELISRNGAESSDGYIYVQVTRGAEYGRNHAPLPEVPRTVFAFAAPWPTGRPGWLENGLPAVTADDTRWARCDIKSVSLLANVLLRQLAVDDDASETILIRDGQLTDASASSVHAVIGGVLCTPPNLLEAAAGHDARRHRRDRREGRRGMAIRAGIRSRICVSASEILLGAATREIQPVTMLDGNPVGTGKPGPVWRKLYDAYQAYKREVAGTPW